MTRMRFTTQAMNLFTQSLLDGSKKGGVGSENLDFGLPDTTLNLKVRDTVKKIFGGGALGPEDVQKLQKSAFDGGTVTDEEAVYLLQVGLKEDNFQRVKVGGRMELTEEARAARFDLLRFAVMHLADIDPKAATSEKEAALAANSQVMREYIKGTVRAIVSTGEAEAAYLQAARKAASGVRANAAISDLPVKANAQEVLKVFLEQTEAINGWKFLEPGKNHNVLVKPGINWGINGYPTVSSWESVYAAAMATHQKGAAVGSNVKVTVADESGIENKDFGRTTMDNMEDTGILGGAVLAGVEVSFNKQGLRGAAAHDAAVKFLAEKLRAAGVNVPENAKAADVAPLVRRNHTELLDRAREAGVVVIPLDEQQTMVLKPVSKGPGEPVAPDEANMTPQQLRALKHFQDGIRVSTALKDVTDIINLPKPPGRHGIMSNCGLTGAVKNYIGLMSGVDRSENLHSKWARTPPRRDGETAGNYVDRIKEFVTFLGDRGVNEADVKSQPHVGRDARGLGDWKKNEAELLNTAAEWVANMKSEGQKLADESGNEAEGPGQQWFEKLAELNLFFKDKERFTFTDMRKTVSSFGPDFGEQLDVGKAIASDSAAVVDALASAELKRAYENDKSAGFGSAEEFSELEKNNPGLKGLPGRLLARVRDAMSSTYKEAQEASFLRGKDPFKLKNHVAVMSYPGLAPSDMMNVNLKMAPDDVLKSEYLGKRSLRPGGR
ncbi:MAG: DUF362 domain-containing protein [Myxococcota bacterium]